MHPIQKRLLAAVLIVSALACNFLTSRLRPVLPPTPVPATRVTDTATPLPRPAYIPPGCENAAIATLPVATTLALSTPDIQANPAIDQSTQLKVFDETAKVISDVYVYPDFNGKDWNAIVTKHRAAVAAGLTSEAFYNEMQTMVKDLGDAHSRFDSPVDVAEVQAKLSGTSEYVGIGVLVMPQTAKKNIAIVGVFPDSPAEHSGLRSHDAILSVDGLPLIEGDQDFAYRVRGPECSTARLTVQSPGQAPRDVLVMRHRIEGDLPIQAQLIPTKDGARIGYIMLPSFLDEKIPGQVSEALKKFGNLDGLILDNRLNGGGTSDVLEPVLSHFIGGNLGEFRSRHASRPLQLQADPVANSDTVPLVVLVGDGTASFGEIFSGVLQDQGRAKVVGQTTSGNVEILHGYDFEDGSRLWIAEETFDPARSHANWEQTGIVPEVQAHADWDTFTMENDPAILASLTLLGHPAP